MQSSVSAVPAGLAVIPVVRKGLGPNAPRGEKVASVGESQSETLSQAEEGSIESDDNRR